MKQITKCHALQVYVAVENLDVMWCVCVSVCVCVVCVMSLAALRVRFPICSGGLVVSLYDTHEADTLERN
jgi:hypothetical protein